MSNPMVSRWRGRTSVLLVAAAAMLSNAPSLAAQEPLPCSKELNHAWGELAPLPPYTDSRLSRVLQGAMPLFRLHRSDRALKKLDWALEELDGDWGTRFEAPLRRELKKAFAALRNCIAQSEPPGLASATIRTYMEDDLAPEHRGRPAPSGAFVYVERTRVGRTAEGGVATVQVPSGPVRLRAVLPEFPGEGPATCEGHGGTNLRPGGSAEVTIVIDCGKAPYEDTELVLMEAVSDVVASSATSFRLQFTDDGVPVPVSRLARVAILQQDTGEIDRLISNDFRVAAGVVVAKDPRRVLNSFPRDIWIVLQVAAADDNGLRHEGEIRFRLGREP